MVATTAQWDAVAGTTGGLAFGANYFLSAGTAGLLTATAPTTKTTAAAATTTAAANTTTTAATANATGGGTADGAT